MVHKQKNYKKMLESIQGRTIAVVYIFEKDEIDGYKHYEVWKSDVISSWINAIQALNCFPLILDLRTFVFKAMNSTLPSIDFIINLNNGCKDISTLGLVPSLCCFLNIPCIPCDTVSTIVGEHKKLSNIIAYYKDMKIPKTMCELEEGGIYRPYYYGSSCGVSKSKTNLNGTSLYQEFIAGFDMTIPVMYNPITEKLDILPPTMYIPNSNDVNWFLGENEKKLHNGYTKKITRISKALEEKVLSLADEFSIKTFCRIDTRVECDSIENFISTSKDMINVNNTYFLEINPMPTIKEEINFHFSIKGITKDYNLYESLEEYKKFFSNNSITGYILANSMLYFITKYEK